MLWFHRGSNRLGRHTTMGRKGETTKFKGAKPAPSEAAKKERKRKKKRDREDEKDAERLGARARLNRSRPYDFRTAESYLFMRLTSWAFSGSMGQHA